ncbi:MAG: DUF2723 domain-containing protein [Chloroflexota bacterium]
MAILSAWSKYRLVIILTVLVMALYLLTLAPTVLWGDDAYLQRTAFEASLRPDGAGHWLWLTLARLMIRLPFGEITYRVNLVSALAGTATITGLFLAARSLGLSKEAATVAAATLAVAHTFWMHAVRAEVYTVFTVLMVAELLLLFRWNEQNPWPLYGTLALFGLTLLGHQMAVLLGPAMAFLIWRRKQWLSLRDWLLSTTALAAGLLPALIIIQRQILAPDLVHSLVLYFTHSGEDFRGSLFDYSLGLFPRDLALWGMFLALQFPSPAILLALLFIGDVREWIRRDQDRWQALLLLYVTCIAFAFSYRVNDQYVFYLPSYVAFALIAGRGWDFIAARWPWLKRPLPRRVLVGSIVVLPPLVYWGMSVTFRQLDVNPLHIRELPGREPNSFFLWPGKGGYWGARDYGEDALLGLPSDSVLLADHTPFHTLKYLQVVEGMRSDVRLRQIGPDVDLNRVVESFPASSIIFLADNDPRYYNLQSLLNMRLVRRGVVYQLVGSTESGG